MKQASLVVAQLHGVYPADSQYFFPSQLPGGICVYYNAELAPLSPQIHLCFTGLARRPFEVVISNMAGWSLNLPWIYFTPLAMGNHSLSSVLSLPLNLFHILIKREVYIQRLRTRFQLGLNEIPTNATRLERMQEDTQSCELGMPLARYSRMRFSTPRQL